MKLPFTRNRTATAAVESVRREAPGLALPADVPSWESYSVKNGYKMFNHQSREVRGGLTGERVRPWSSSVAEAVITRVDGWLTGEASPETRPRDEVEPGVVLGAAALGYDVAMAYLADADPQVYSDDAFAADCSAHEFVSEVFTGTVTAIAAQGQRKLELAQIMSARTNMERANAAPDPVLDARMLEQESAKQALIDQYAVQIAEAVKVMVDVTRARAGQARAVAETMATIEARERAMASVAVDTPPDDPRLVRLQAVSDLVAGKTIGVLEGAEAEITRQREIRRSL